MLNNIQISRGFAVVIVVLAHANLLIDKNLFNGFLIIGWCGVDFFFVLSGFIIYYTNKNKFGQPYEVRNYLVRRFNRIYPVYWLYMLFTLVIYSLLIVTLNIDILGWADLSVSGILKNILLLPTDLNAKVSPILPVAWTLTYEIIFYLLFGLALFLGGGELHYL